MPADVAARRSPGIALPARDVATVALAAGRAVGAERVEVIGPPALAGAAVVVRAIPRVLRNVLLEVGPIPAIGAERPLTERGEPFLRARVTTGVQPERIERRAEQLDLGARRFHLRDFGLPDETRSDERHQ